MRFPFSVEPAGAVGAGRTGILSRDLHFLGRDLPFSSSRPQHAITLLSRRCTASPSQAAQRLDVPQTQLLFG